MNKKQNQPQENIWETPEVSTDVTEPVVATEVTKSKKQKITLAIVLVLGAVIVSLAFWYRLVQDKQHQADLASKIQNFSF